MKPPFKILYEDAHLLAVEKPAGMASVPAPEIPESRTLQGKFRTWAFPAQGYKPYLLNRLDVQTSGIVLFGKFPRDREKLEAIFMHPDTKKTYLAMVKGVPKKKQSSIYFPIEARHRDKKVPATTHYRVLEIFDNASLLEVTIETGRKHQIRKHLSMIGHPLAMDRDYGDHVFNQKFSKIARRKHMFLHAWKMEFLHPFLLKKVFIEATPKKID